MLDFLSKDIKFKETMNASEINNQVQHIFHDRQTSEYLNAHPLVAQHAMREDIERTKGTSYGTNISDTVLGVTDGKVQFKSLVVITAKRTSEPMPENTKNTKNTKNNNTVQNCCILM